MRRGPTRSRNRPVRGSQFRDEWSTCQAYDGRSFIPRKRDYVNPDGQITTVLADGRCEHCREYPGHQRGRQAPPV